MGTPKPNTSEMVTLLHSYLMGSLEEARMLVTFTTGDVMSAALHIIVESGLVSVSPEQLKEDIATAVDLTLEDYICQRGKAN